MDQQKSKGVYSIGQGSVEKAEGASWNHTSQPRATSRRKCPDEALVGDRQSPGGAVVKNPPAHAGGAKDAGSIPGSGRSPGGGWQPTPVFLPGESHGRGAWRVTVHGVAESDTTEHTHIQRHWGRKAGMVWSSRILADC